MSTDSVYDCVEGTSPLLISVPHDGRLLPADIEASMTPSARRLPDTDWHVAKLYDFAPELGAGLLVARYSRYVVDLNRAENDASLYANQVSTGVCPQQTFAGEPIYRDGVTIATAQRIDRYWRPYHAEIERCLAKIKARHGFALLWDAHSIASTVPRLFDGELPQLNVGTNTGASCPLQVQTAVSRVAERSDYSLAINERFRGGYITRHFGSPDESCYAIQLEIAQRCYMDELTLRYDAERAAALRDTLGAMLDAYIDSAHRMCGDAR